MMGEPHRQPDLPRRVDAGINGVPRVRAPTQDSSQKAHHRHAAPPADQSRPRPFPNLTYSRGQRGLSYLDRH